MLGPEALARLKECAGAAEAEKLDRAPTLVLASAALSGDLVQDEEDVCATAAAIMLVLLAATERGLASYWRTPAILRTARGREAAGVPDGERVLGLLHFGAPAREPAARERAPVDAYVSLPRLTGPAACIGAWPPTRTSANPSRSASAPRTATPSS